MKYAGARSPSEADHPVGEDGDGVRLSEEQRLDCPQSAIDRIWLLIALSRQCRSRRDDRRLDLLHRLAIGFRVLEQMSVKVIGHSDAGMPHHSLHALGRPSEV